MNGTNENKVDSLIAELRSFGDRPPPRFAWNRIADELESAVKEEREMLREAATAKMLEGATIIDNRGHGNAAALSEALVKIRNIIMGGGFDGRSPAHIVNICDAALSAPRASAEMSCGLWKRVCEFIMADFAVNEFLPTLEEDMSNESFSEEFRELLNTKKKLMLNCLAEEATKLHDLLSEKKSAEVRGPN